MAEERRHLREGGLADTARGDVGAVPPPFAPSYAHERENASPTNRLVFCVACFLARLLSLDRIFFLSVVVKSHSR